MLQNNAQMLEQVKRLPCPTCGNHLSFSVEKQAISCEYCGFSKAFDKANHLVLEQSLKLAEQKLQKFSPKAINKKVVDCKGCGAQLMLDSTEVALRCNFCGSEKVNETAFEKNLIQPIGIIPFQVAKKQAVDKFKTWIKKGWFHPNKLQQLAALGDVHGIYVPFWTYDAQSYTEWQGEAGYYYYENESVYEDGKWVNKSVKKTRWEYRRGSFQQFFNDELIVASKGLPEAIIENIFPFDLQKLINFNNDLLVGWESEIYNIEVKDGYQKAEQRMLRALENEASKALGGDTQRSLRIDADFYDQTFKHIILPIWLCTYQYQGKAYQFAVNGQTGTIHGQKPISTIKIVGLVLIILAIIAIIVLLFSSSS